MKVSGLLGAAARLAVIASPEAVTSEPDSFASMEAFANLPFPAATPTATEEERVAWTADLRAWTELKRACDAIGSRLIVFDPGIPHSFSKALERSVGDLGITYDPAGRTAFARAARGESVYLPRDGHWSPNGSRIVARQLARETAAAAP